MLIVRAFLCCALVSLVRSTEFGFRDSTDFLRSKAKAELANKVHAAFTSDRFQAADSSTAKELSADSFSPTGSLLQSFYLPADLTPDDTCSDLWAVYGFMVNECFIGRGYSCKFQLTSDSCEGAITQYFEDDDCTSYLGFSSFTNASIACAPFQDTTPTQYEQIQCTTREAPAFPDTSNIIGVTYYKDGTCSGAPVEYAAVVADRCYRYNNNNKYFAYKCDNETPTMAKYTNPNCTGTPIKEEHIRSTCYYMPDTNNTDAMPPQVLNPPPTVSTTSYPVAPGAPRRTFDEFCTSNAPTIRPAQLPTVGPTFQPSATQSPTVEPTVRPTTTPQPSEVPTTVPTELPTVEPTLYPTRAVAKQSTFEVNQALTGIDAVTFNANEANAAALKLTIATTLLDKNAIISDLRVTDTTAPQDPSGPLAALNLRAVFRGTDKKEKEARGKGAWDTTSQINVAYTITSAQSVYTAQELYTQLSEAVTSGAFTTALVANAQSLGATDIVACSSESVVAADLGATDDDGGAAVNAAHDSLSSGGIFGVVVGVLFIAAMFVGGIYVIFAKRQFIASKTSVRTR